MGKKYLLEIEENKDGSFAWSNFAPYTAPDLEQVRKEAYEQGRKDGKIEGRAEAWDAARKICLNDSDGGLTVTEIAKIFDVSYYRDAMKKYSAHEAIEKIRQYEQEKEELKQLQVGDEVATDAGNRASVLYENPDGTQAFVFKSDGTAAWWTKSALHRTGRNFPEIAAVLEKMREESNG